MHPRSRQWHLLDYALVRRREQRDELVSSSEMRIRLQPRSGPQSKRPLSTRSQHAVKQLSGGKAPGSVAIPPEIYKHGGPQIIDHLTALFQEMWRQGEVPKDFNDATIMHLYKRKGNCQICDNH
ncbi:hypothetical protein SprV_0301314300 [Sparganum proliferum]